MQSCGLVGSTFPKSLPININFGAGMHVSRIIFNIGFDAGLRLTIMPLRDHAELRASGLSISLTLPSALELECI